MNTKKLKMVAAGSLVILAGTASYFACNTAQTPSTTAQTRLTKLTDESGNVLEEAYLRIPLPASEQQYADIDGHHMKELLKEVTAISLKSRDDGNKYWGRISGTEYEEMTADWAEAKFRNLGMQDIHRQEFDMPPQYFPTSWDATFTGGGKTYRGESLIPAYRSVPTPAGGLELDAVWVGTGTSADFLGRDVRGKAVFIHTIPAPGDMGHSASPSWEGAIQRAAEKGAAAIFVVYGISDNFAIWNLGWRRMGAVDVPAFWMGYEDGKVVREMLGQGQPVKVKMHIDVEMREGLTTPNQWGTLPGTTDENIIVIAHMDGYFEAALDNASGLSVMMTLAEHFAKIPQEQRRRNLVFIGTAGHHSGSLGTKWLHDNRETALAKTALMINCEHISATQTVYWGPKMRKTNIHSPRRWWVHGSDRLTEIVLNAYAMTGVSVWAEMEPNAAGDMGHCSRDVPSIQLIRSPEIKHTDSDTPEWVPEAGLEAVARAYAKIIDEANQLDAKDLPAAAPTTGEP